MHGALVAATEDHLHATEPGVLLNIAKVAHHGLAASESAEFEQIIQGKVAACGPSALVGCPRGTTKKSFGNLTLCSHKEKVGIVRYLLLALHDK